MQNDITLSANEQDIYDATAIRAVIKTRFAPKNPLWRCSSFVLIHCILTPIARLRRLFGTRHIVRGNHKLRGYKRSGYFLFGALPNNSVDMTIPLALCDPKHTYTLTPSRVKGGKTVISPWRLLCGDIPIPADASDARLFLEAVEKRAVERGAVVVYPSTLEGIDPSLDPYAFPARFDEPAFCFTTVTEADEQGRPCVVTYLDGPFYAKEGASLEEQTADMRARITERMNRRRVESCKEADKS